MGIFTGIILYVMIFWLLIFMVLPWGNKVDETVETGNSTGAPANPRIKQKFMITAGLSVVVWVIVFSLIHFQVIDFYAIAKQMTQEDFSE